MLNVCITLLLLTISLIIQGQEKWRLNTIGMQSGLAAIQKKLDRKGWVMQWDVAVSKNRQLLAVEYETATSIRIDDNKYAVDQINLLYGLNLLQPKQGIQLYVLSGLGFYRQSNRLLHTSEAWNMETAAGLKLALKAAYLVGKRWQLTVNPNSTLNFSNTYFSLLAGFGYRF